MAWKFEPVAGPFTGPLGGLAWDGSGMLVSATEAGFIYRHDPARGEVTEWRKYANRVNGIAFAPEPGVLYGCQEGGRRIIQFQPGGSANPTATRIDGKVHNFPCDLCVDRKGRVWFSDPYSPVLAFGPQIFPALDHASVLRLSRDERAHWHLDRVTDDTVAPRAVLLSPDERTLYVAEGDAGRSGARELRAYPIGADGRTEAPVVLHTFGADHRGAHRGIEGMCLDAEGNLVTVCGSRRSGPGPHAMVLTPSGTVLESHPLPGDLPARCAFGGADLGTLYISTLAGELFTVTGTGRRGYKRF
ncbi:MAG: SMP-30/gluconolactonase/LRE family protein [Proteobacteria bacterium]|nr:SMP-30/gluconolactonase/LRE family protein [Burkholderiales bacterium]